MEISFDAQRALVTGAGQGIGRDIATLLAQCGATVVTIDRNGDDLRTLQAEIGGEMIVADLADPSAAREAARRAGSIDLLVNNAGIGIFEPFLETTVESFDLTIAINVRAIMVVSQVVAAGMIARGHGGAIVNISSQASEVALTNHTAYSVSKGAVNQLTRIMALELGPHQIRVNAVLPTVTMTALGQQAWSDPAKSGPMKARIPLGRFAQPIDIAHAVVYLLSAQADMINGAMLSVDGGFLAN